MKHPELTGVCKECKYKCGRVENPLFTGVKKCEYATVEDKAEQMQIKELLNERNLERCRRL